MGIASLRTACLLAGLALAISWPVQPASARDGKPTLLLLPVVVHSSENPDYLRSGLADMLATRFIQEGSFEIRQIEDPRRATTRLGEALAAAREEGTDFVLFGSFTRFGEGASLDMQAASTAEGEQGATLREIFVHSGSIGEVIPDLADLVGKVTRFAIPGYVPAALSSGSGAEPAAAAGSATQATRDEIADLRRRISALEKSIRALENAAAEGAQ